MVLVKICGLMHSEDILAVNTAGADLPALSSLPGGIKYRLSKRWP